MKNIQDEIFKNFRDNLRTTLCLKIYIHINEGLRRNDNFYSGNIISNGGINENINGYISSVINISIYQPIANNLFK